MHCSKVNGPLRPNENFQCPKFQGLTFTIDKRELQKVTAAINSTKVADHFRCLVVKIKTGSDVLKPVFCCISLHFLNLNALTSMQFTDQHTSSKKSNNQMDDAINH